MRASKAKTRIRQEQIARAALKLLAVRGWQKVSLAAIAREVGVVTSDVYRHFHSKDEVLDAVLEAVAQSFRENLRLAQEATNDPLELLHGILQRHVVLIASGRLPVPRIVLSEDIFTGNPRHRLKVWGIYQSYLGAITAIVRKGQELGTIRRELSALTLARMWLGLVQSPAILWLLSGVGFDLTRHSERAWELFRLAIASESTSAPA